MKTRPTRPDEIIRADGRIERVCEHGVGHPVGHVREWHTWMGIHGCEGCCGRWAEEEGNDEGRIQAPA